MFFAKRVVIASLGQKLFVISLDQQIFYSLKRSFKHMGFYGDFQGELQLFRYMRYFVINRFVITRFKCSTKKKLEKKKQANTKNEHYRAPVYTMLTRESQK